MIIDMVKLYLCPISKSLSYSTLSINRSHSNQIKAVSLALEWTLSTEKILSYTRLKLRVWFHRWLSLIILHSSQTHGNQFKTHMFNLVLFQITLETMLLGLKQPTGRIGPLTFHNRSLDKIRRHIHSLNSKPQLYLIHKWTIYMWMH